MADLNKVFGVIRVVILVVVSLFAALVLIMGALVTSFTMSKVDGYFIYAAFALAISALTLLTVPVMIALSLTRKGAFSSMIVVELSYFAVLWILWLAVGATIGNIPWINYCSDLGTYYYAIGYTSACMETQSMAAFAFLNWILLMTLNIFLLSLAIVQANRGNSAVWTSSVSDTDYSAPAASTEPKLGYGNPTSEVPVTPVGQYSQPGTIPTQQIYPQQVYTPPPQHMGTQV